MGSLTKGMIGKEDMSIQTNASAAETFNRLTSTGSTMALTKIPDIWDGTGKVHAGEVTTRHYASSYSTIASAIAAVNALTDKILYIDNGDWAVGTTDLSSYTTVKLCFLPGATISPTVGTTLTIYSPSNIIAQPNQQIFSGAGTVLFSDQGTVYPEWWGVDGTADDVQIQAAIDSLPTYGGTVKLTGYYNLATYIALTNLKENIQLVGDTSESTVITAVGATTDAIRITGASGAGNDVSFCILQNFGISRDTVDVTTGNGLVLNELNLCRFENLAIYHAHIGISMIDVMYCSFDNIIISRGGGADNAVGIYINGTDDAGADHNNPSNHFNNILFDASACTGVARIAFSIVGERWNDNYFRWCEAGNCEYGFYLVHTPDASSTYPFTCDVHIQNCILDNITTAGIYMDGGNSVQIAGNWIYMPVLGTTVTRAIYMEDCLNCSVVNNVLFTYHYDYARGIELDSCIGNTFQGNTIVDFEYGLFTTDSDYNSIVGNTFNHPQAANPAAGHIDLVTSDNNIISANILNGYATAGVIIGAGSTSNLISSNNLADANVTTEISNAGTTTKCRANIGYVTQNCGYLAVTSTTPFPHGLAAAPSCVTLQACETGVTDMYVSGDATNITVVYTGAAGKFFFWKANTALDT